MNRKTKEDWKVLSIFLLSSVQLEEEVEWLGGCMDSVDKLLNPEIQIQCGFWVAGKCKATTVREDFITSVINVFILLKERWFHHSRKWKRIWWLPRMIRSQTQKCRWRQLVGNSWVTSFTIQLIIRFWLYECYPSSFSLYFILLIIRFYVLRRIFLLILMNY